MAAITVPNTDWAVIDAVVSALAEATIGGQAVFQSVTATTSADQAKQCQFTDSPAAIVRYLATSEKTLDEQIVRATLSMELVLATRLASPASDQSARLEEILHLVNAAKLAIAADPPSQACDWGRGEDIDFGRAKIDLAESDPWTVAVVPASFTFVLDDRTASTVMSIPTFCGVALVSRAARDMPGSPQVRLAAETMPGLDGQYVQLHGKAGREIVMRGVLEAAGATAVEAHQALKTALRSMQAGADGATVGPYVGTDGASCSPCLLTSYNATGEVRISPTNSTYQALVSIEARILQLAP